MSKELVLVDPKEYGIEPSKLTDLLGNLPQIKKEREILTEQYDTVIKLDIEDKKTAVQAKEIRIKIRDNRTKGIEVWHKNTKEYFLKGGQFVDAIKRKESAVNELMEENLELIEKHQEIIEQQRKNELKSKRLSELKLYSEFLPNGIELGVLTDEEYKKLFNGAKLQYDAKVENERIAEIERQENIRLDKVENERRLEFAPFVQFLSHSPELRNMKDSEYQNLLKFVKEAKKAHDDEQKRIRKENEELKAEAEKKEAEIKREREKAEKERIEAEKKRQQELEVERKKQQELEARLKAEQEKKEAEIREQKEAEDARRKEAEKLAKAPIKKQLKEWVKTFSIPATSINNETSNEIIQRFESFKKWADNLVDTL